MFNTAASKVLIQNPEGKYLILHRNNHPKFGFDIDLPGGTVEHGEDGETAAIREVREESGIDLSGHTLELLMSSRKYSRSLMQFNLYKVQLLTTPKVTLSWEHADAVWLTREEIIAQSASTRDSFLTMVRDVLSDAVHSPIEK